MVEKLLSLSQWELCCGSQVGQKKNFVFFKTGMERSAKECWRKRLLFLDISERKLNANTSFICKSDLK